MDSLGIGGAWVYAPQIYYDDRGSFLESFRGAEFAADLGYRLDVAQANCSVSRRGVIKGVHFADVPPGQAKYVSCLRGGLLPSYAECVAYTTRLHNDDRKVAR